MTDFGECIRCGGKIRPIWFTEKETKFMDGHMYYTGRVRRAVSHLECTDCFKNYAVDDSFDGEWRYP